MSIPEIRNYKQKVYSPGIWGGYIGERTKLQYKNEWNEWEDIPTAYDYIYLDK